MFSKASLAHRKRQLVRDELTEAALKLLAFKGFEETTIDQIAAAAGVSRRTFFRYFQSKEDVVIEFLGHVGEQLRAALAARTAKEEPAAAVRQALSVFIDVCAEYPEKSIRLTCLILNTPALTARYLERQLEWKSGIGAELAKRMRARDGDLRPVIVTDIAVTDLGALLDQTFALAFPTTVLTGPCHTALARRRNTVAI